MRAVGVELWREGDVQADQLGPVQVRPRLQCPRYGDGPGVVVALQLPLRPPAVQNRSPHEAELIDLEPGVGRRAVEGRAGGRRRPAVGHPCEDGSQVMRPTAVVGAYLAAGADLDVLLCWSAWGFAAEGRRGHVRLWIHGCPVALDRGLALWREEVDVSTCVCAFVSIAYFTGRRSVWDYGLRWRTLHAILQQLNSSTLLHEPQPSTPTTQQ